MAVLHDRYLDDVIVRPRPALKDYNHCPRCGGYLCRDGSDVACSLKCGWRESYPDTPSVVDPVTLAYLLYNRATFALDR